MATETDRIHKQILLRAPIARVWQAVSDSRQFGTWFGVKFDTPFEPGVRIVGTIVPTKADPQIAEMQKPYEGRTFDFTVERIEPQRLFSFRWHPFAVDPDFDYSNEPTTLVTFELQEAAKGTLLTITESGFDRIPLGRRAKAFTSNEQGWTAQISLIEKYLGHAA